MVEIEDKDPQIAGRYMALKGSLLLALTQVNFIAST